MKKHIKYLLIIIVTMTMLTSCGLTDNIFVKLGLRNDKFEYLNEGNIQSVAIQSTRDKNFEFIITDMNVLRELYEILSKGKETEEKSSLKPDYIFEIQMKNRETKKYYYVAGLDKENKGNFYNDGEKYIISSRIDNDLLKNFFNIRTPLRFKEVYYTSIMEAMKMFEELENYNKINVDIDSDKEAAKFIVSTEEEEFRKQLQSKFNNCTLNEETENGGLNIKVKTIGYKSSIIKIIIDFKEGKEDIKRYYVVGKHIDKSWNIDISEEKPNNFEE